MATKVCAAITAVVEKAIWNPEGFERLAEQTATAEGVQQRDARHHRWEYQRQQHERSDHVPPAEGDAGQDDRHRHPEQKAQPGGDG